MGRKENGEERSSNFVADMIVDIIQPTVTVFNNGNNSRIY